MTHVDYVWRPPPENVALAIGDVHVWRVSLDSVAWRAPGLYRALLVDEDARASRFYFQRDRDRFVASQTALRSILVRYLPVEPRELRFCYNDYGKPSLCPELGGATLRFNLSHSHGLALYALTLGQEVGVDIEYIRVDLVDESIAEQFFSRREVAELRALPKTAQVVAFFNCWTRKEAFVKAKGQGLSQALDQFDVSLAPGEPARLKETRFDPQEALRWTLQDLAPGPGYVAALAIEGEIRSQSCWQWIGGDA